MSFSKVIFAVNLLERSKNLAPSFIPSTLFAISLKLIPMDVPQMVGLMPLSSILAISLQPIVLTL